MNEMVAQVYIFFIAGFDTTSATTSLTMYELTKNHDIQEKVYQEVQDVLNRHNGEVTYESIAEMTYLDKVVNGECFRPNACGGLMTIFRDSIFVCARFD